jgi:HK97 family phage portal protein
VASRAASTALEVTREIGEESEEIINHPFELLLKRPNPLNSRFEFLEATFLWRLLTGNAYWWLNKATENDVPTEMWIIPAHQIEPVPDGNLYLRGYLYDPGDGQKIPLEPWEVVHFRRFNPFSRFVGLSPIESLATVAIGDLKMQEWNTKFFGEENAKIPGVLAFADPINQTEWERLQADVKEQGKKRSMLMLRNTGAGGVNWVAMALSQKEMEFLQARRFNQSEIYDLFAPGLYQWLAPDTTNANSRSGRDAFLELAVYPLHTAVAETATNNVLPLYGDDLVAEFEDVRPKDRALILQEQQAFGQVHTIDEVRAEYYKQDPLGDERGLLLPAEVTTGRDPVGGFPGRDIIAQPAPEAESTKREREDKDREREQFRRYAQKRVDEGKPEKITGFAFHHLDDGEQAALKAEYAQPDNLSVLSERLTSVIDALRSNHAADPESAE